MPMFEDDREPTPRSAAPLRSPDLRSPALGPTLHNLIQRLLESRNLQGYWEGELASSPLSTATAVMALSLDDRRRPGSASHECLVRGGLEWLARIQNPDGGWGDTIRSFSNISTTALCWSALGLAARNDDRHGTVLQSAESWLTAVTGGLTPEALARAIARRYGKDRTFSVPILMVLALAGRLGPAKDGWRRVPQLPFELAAFPQAFFRWLRLPVVSYALPALIAIGQARHDHRPTRNPLARVLRRLARERTLRVLTSIQPEGGGFLEAVPLTSFVVMSLVESGRRDHPVVRKGVEFLRHSARPDGSWPIDTNLSTWVTTLAINALSSAPALEPPSLEPDERERLRHWLIGQQYCRLHPYTGAPPGGWAWTNLPGGVPDADDTAGALVALRNLGTADESVRASAENGVRWLLELQNRDGGMPTFCRGWGSLPFDRSSPDLTAHALLAWSLWNGDLPASLARRVGTASARGIRYLEKAQRADGAWVPLWFGNQHSETEENPTYGTARVMIALRQLERQGYQTKGLTGRAEHWLLSAQNSDGGWGGAQGAPSSIEETALALQALASICEQSGAERMRPSAIRGVNWLASATDCGRSFTAAPIGLYFAKLWYFEKLYPLIFAVGGLRAVRSCLGAGIA
jgi:squalene-hopene/tetraprenyl-beta-curcumene cyclase